MQQHSQQLIPATPPPHFLVWLYWEPDNRTDTAEKRKIAQGKKVIFELHPFPEPFHQMAAQTARGKMNCLCKKKTKQIKKTIVFLTSVIL